jgi:uncharacterized protein (TIGR02646 family)
MRPVLKGTAYLFTDGGNYSDAREGLAARIGLYCCYCERPLIHCIEIEHIQPKSVFPGLGGFWINFLLACKNCNSTKGDKNPPLSDWLIPDRDNTFFAFQYLEDGIIEAKYSLAPQIKLKAEATLSLVGLNKKVEKTFDETNNLVALDRRNQRLEAWAKAQRYRDNWNQKQCAHFGHAIVDLAVSTGFFSIWMAAFEGEPVIRKKLLNAFSGTALCCFDALTTVPVSPHSNFDQLMDGGKV